MTERKINQEAVDKAIDRDYWWWYGDLRMDPADIVTVIRSYLDAVNPLVKTREQLEKLPLGTAVVDDTDDLMQYLPDGEGGTYWLRLGDTSYYGPEDVFLPARVIQMGDLDGQD